MKVLQQKVEVQYRLTSHNWALDDKPDFNSNIVYATSLYSEFQHHFEKISRLFSANGLLASMFLEAVVRKCSIKKVFLKISQILQENTRAGNFIKKETLAQVFSCEIAKFLRKPFFKEHLRWLLLFFHVINNYLELN